MDAIWEGAKQGLIKLMDMDGGFTEFMNFKQDLAQIFGTIMAGVLLWFLVNMFSSGKLGSLVKVIVVCRIIIILAY
jgi:uncharacterized protein (DUF3820 family)